MTHRKFYALLIATALCIAFGSSACLDGIDTVDFENEDYGAT
ncbi:MAG: hypothetical protein ACPHRO_00705 [Nannocystaceae bacterium]